MPKHQHRFIARPITGMNVGPKGEREVLFGYNLECEQCQRAAKSGDTVVEVKASAFKELIPENVAVEYVVPAKEA